MTSPGGYITLPLNATMHVTPTHAIGDRWAFLARECAGAAMPIATTSPGQPGIVLWVNVHGYHTQPINHHATAIIAALIGCDVADANPLYGPVVAAHTNGCDTTCPLLPEEIAHLHRLYRGYTAASTRKVL